MKVMSSPFAYDRGTQGKSFLTQINTADAGPQQILRSQVHILKLKKAKIKCHRIHARVETTVLPVKWWTDPNPTREKKKKGLFYRWLALLFDNFVMQRWKSSVEISEHSTWLQNRGATDNLIYDLQTRRANTHTCARARGGARGVIDGGMNNGYTQVNPMHTDKLTHTHRPAGTCRCWWAVSAMLVYWGDSGVLIQIYTLLNKHTRPPDLILRWLRKVRVGPQKPTKCSHTKRTDKLRRCFHKFRLRTQMTKQE